MKMLLLLLTILILEYGLGYSLMKKKEIGTPSLIVCATMIVSVFLGVIGSHMYWKTDIHLNTVLYFSISILIMIIIDILSSYFIVEKNASVLFKPKQIKISAPKLLVSCGVGLVTIVLQLKNVISTVGLSSFGKMMFAYRTAYNAGDIEQPGLLGQLVLLTTLLAYVFCYAFSYNIVYHGNIRHNYLNLIPIFILCISGLLDGARGKLVNIVLSCVFFTYYFYQRKTNKKKSNNSKIARKMILFGIVGMFIFIQLGSLLGRNKYNFGPMFEICEYAGAETILFDKYVNGDFLANTSGLWGQSTFENIYNYLQEHFKLSIPDYNIYQYGMSNNIPLGNVYTALLPWYHDFGFLGVIIFSSLLGMTFSFVYRKMGNIRKKNVASYCILMYGYFINCLFLFLFNDRFFSRVGPQLLRVFVYFWILKYFILDMHIKTTFK